MRTLWILVGTWFLAHATLGAVQTQRIEYKEGDTVLEGVLAWDDTKASAERPAPGVVVCPEWWGMNDYSQSRAKQLAELGYVAFAIDVFGKGKVTTDPKQAGQWAGEVMKDEKVRRARAAAGLKVLLDQKMVDRSKVAAIGYCMGGTLAVELARTGADLKAVVAFHASTYTAQNAADNKQIKGTVVVCQGAEDTFVPEGEQIKFEKQMKEAGVDFVLAVYSGAVHAFTNPNVDGLGIPGVKYDKNADARSWKLMQDIFAEKLGSAAS